jgi:hypothetical protein
MTPRILSGPYAPLPAIRVRVRAERRSGPRRSSLHPSRCLGRCSRLHQPVEGRIHWHVPQPLGLVLADRRMVDRVEDRSPRPDHHEPIVTVCVHREPALLVESVRIQVRAFSVIVGRHDSSLPDASQQGAADPAMWAGPYEIMKP